MGKVLAGGLATCFILILYMTVMVGVAVVFAVF